MDLIKYEQATIQMLQSFYEIGGLACICNGDSHKISLEVE